MKLNQVAAQLYTVRAHLKTTEGFAESIKKAKAIGYQAVQLSGVGADVSVADQAKIMADHGMVCCATHEKGAEICDETNKVIDKLKALNCKYTAYPSPHVPLETEAQVKELAAKLNEAGRTMREAGLVLAYHNHNNEFMKRNGRTVWDILFAETDPKNLLAEPDTYWVHLGGVENTQLLKTLKGRVPLLHMKDYYTKEDRTPYYCEIGNGNLPFQEIVPAAEACGCEWFIVEQDVCPGDEFESLKISFDYIKANLVS